MAGINDVLNIDRLPAMPGALVRVMSLLLEPDSNWGEIERTVRNDEALTSSVLRLANSAAYGAPGRRFDLRSALTRLGRDTLRRALVQQEVAGVTVGDNAAFGLQRGAMWRSALGGAVAAEEFARCHCPDDAPLAFVCGLLRDIGKLALNTAFDARYAADVNAHAVEGRSFIEAERAALGFDHAQVGAALARKWKLPERIAAAIEHHHQPPPPGPGHDPLFDAVHAADTVCRWAGLGVGIDGLDYTLAPHVRGALNLDRPAVERSIALLWQRLREAEAAHASTGTKGAAA